MLNSEDKSNRGGQMSTKRGRRSPLKREHDRTVIAELALRGSSQRAIAQRLGLSQSSVKRDLAVVREEWLQRRLTSRDALVAQELAFVELVQREAFEQWVRSKSEPIQKRASKSRGFAATPRKPGQKVEPSDMLLIEQQLREESRLGDPRYLETLQWCSEQRTRLLGLAAPKPQASSGEFDPSHDYENPRAELLRRVRQMSENMNRQLPMGAQHGDAQMKNVTPVDQMPRALREGDSHPYSTNFSGESGDTEVPDELEALVIRRS
jgi:hypothetical protein